MDNSIQNFNINGITLHFIKMGTGAPLIFLPGSISDYRTWTSIQEQFAHHYECYNISRRFQFPGHYSAGGDSSVAENTGDIIAFIKEKNLSPVIIVGHSFGGFIALNIAIQFPSLVKCIIVEEPIFAPALAKNPKSPIELVSLMFKDFKAGISFARLGIKGIEPTFKALAAGDLKTAQTKFIDGVTGGKRTPHTLDQLTRNQLDDNIAALAGEDPFNNNIKMSDLKKIKCPTLLLSGTDSPYAFQYICQQLKSIINQFQLLQFKNAGHWIHIEQRDAFATALVDFLHHQN